MQDCKFAFIRGPFHVKVNELDGVGGSQGGRIYICNNGGWEGLFCYQESKRRETARRNGVM